jgi:hypothetical protein
VGIGADIIEVLAELRAKGHVRLPGSVAEIGAQQLAGSFLRAAAGISDLGRQFGVTEPLPLPQATGTHLAHGALEHQAEEAPPAAGFWRWLGFRHISVDIDGPDDALALDLNTDRVPRAHRGRYAVVTNFGTTEHVANQLNAFKVIHDLAAPGGVMIHSLPAQGMLCHGLVNYNPKFFWMLARSNGYEVLHQDYRADTVPYSLPEDILGSLTRPEARERLAEYRTIDCGLFMVMRKRFDLEFVPPIDVPTGSKTRVASVRRRYWTVFTPGAFEATAPGRGAWLRLLRRLRAR